MKTRLEIELPKGYINPAVTIDNFFIAYTNDNTNMDKLKFPLPRGIWVLYSVKGKNITLINTRRMFWTKWY
jgi:hypothetical protein